MTALLHRRARPRLRSELLACRNISIAVEAGEIVTLIGANGAGKTTSLRAIAGALSPRPAPSVSMVAILPGLPPTSACNSA